MHGGAKGLGAPLGNEKAFKHGFYRKSSVEERNKLKQFIRNMEESFGNLEKKLNGIQ